MAGNVYGKIDCYGQSLSNTNNDYWRPANEHYVNLFNLLTTMSASNIVELITYFTGSVASGTGLDYWNTANSVGQGAFSVWRWKPNTNRSWDWYLMIQNTSGSTNVNINANCTPSYLDNASTTLPSGMQGLLVQMAISVSGSASYNPWNGTTSMGGAAKGNPVWNTGSNPNATLHVFPRGNNVSGSAIPVASKSLCAHIMGDTTGTPTYYRSHFLADSDSLAIFIDTSPGQATIPINYFAHYFGTFKLIPAISQSNLQYTLGLSGNLGLMMLTSQTMIAPQTRQTHVVPEATSIGPVTLNTSVCPGGVLATTNLGVRQFQVTNDNTPFIQGYTQSPYTNGKFEEKQYMITVNETPIFGLVGWLDSPLFRCTVGIQSHQTRFDGLRTIFGSLTTTNRKISTTWSGSNPPGSNFSRSGTNIFITSSLIY